MADTCDALEAASMLLLRPRQESSLKVTLIICLLQTSRLITQGFVLRNFLPITLGCCEPQASRGGLLRSGNASGPAGKAGSPGSSRARLSCVHGTQSERRQCQSLRAHPETLWSPTLPRFLQFLPDSNAESLQLHFLRGKCLIFPEQQCSLPGAQETQLYISAAIVEKKMVKCCGLEQTNEM